MSDFSMPDMPQSSKALNNTPAEALKSCFSCKQMYEAFLIKQAFSRLTLVKEGPLDDHHWALGIVTLCPACFDEFVSYLPSLLKAIERFTYLKGKSEE